MPYTSLTKPAVGDPTRKDSFADGVIDNLEYLNGILALAVAANIANGSFEVGGAADTAPDNWVLSLAANNHTAIETTAANVAHGARALSMTTPGGVTGGASLVTSDFYPIGELQSISISWFTKSSVAGISNAIYVEWFDRAGSSLSTTTLWSSTSNPTAWTNYTVSATAPANARFFKLELKGVDSTTAGTVYWDGVQLGFHKRKAIIYTTPGAFTYTPNFSGYVKARMWGGGGGGGGGSRTTNGNNGTAGGDSYLDSSSNKARGGGGGQGGQGGGGGTGGAGAAAKQPTYTATLAQFGSQAGQNGTNYNGTSGPAGGGVPYVPNGIMVATMAGIGGNAGGDQPNGTAAPYPNTAQGGVGGNGAFYTPSSIYGSGGAGGQNGEYAELILEVVAGTTYNGSVGAGGAGGAAMGSTPSLSGSGGAGQSGLVIIEEL